MHVYMYLNFNFFLTLIYLVWFFIFFDILSIKQFFLFFFSLLLLQIHFEIPIFGKNDETENQPTKV